MVLGSPVAGSSVLTGGSVVTGALVSVRGKSDGVSLGLTHRCPLAVLSFAATLAFLAASVNGNLTSFAPWRLYDKCLGWRWRVRRLQCLKPISIVTPTAKLELTDSGTDSNLYTLACLDPHMPLSAPQATALCREQHMRHHLDPLRCHRYHNSRRPYPRWQHT